MSSPSVQTSERLSFIPVAQVVVGQNVRAVVEDAEFAELCESIKTRGVVQSLLVRPLGAWNPSDPSATQAYEVVAGGHRYAAALKVGCETLPCLVRSMTDDEVVEYQLTENIQRKDLHPLDLAKSLHRLAEMYKAQGVSASEVNERLQERLQLKRSRVYEFLGLVALCPEVETAFRDGRIDLSAAVELSRVDLDEQQAAMKRLEEAGRSAAYTVRNVREALVTEQHKRDRWRNAVEEATAKGIVLLTPKQMKEIYGERWSWHPKETSGYVALADVCHHDNKTPRRTYAKILGKAKIQVYLGQWNEEPKYLAQAADIAPILKKLKIKLPEASTPATAAPTPTGDDELDKAAAERHAADLAKYQEQQAKARRDEQISDMVAKRINELAFDAITKKNALVVIHTMLTAACDSIDYEIKAKPDLPDMARAALALDHNWNSDYSVEMLDALGIDEKQLRKNAEEELRRQEESQTFQLACERFYGRCYWYNTPNDGKQVIGVTHNTNGALVGWYDSQRKLVKLNSSNLPTGTDDECQAALDQWAKERKLAELELEAPATSKLKGKQAATKGGKK